MNQPVKSGSISSLSEREEKQRLKRALFDKVVHNAEQIGQIKMLPFDMRQVEKARALYKEIEKLYEDMQQ